MKKILSILTVVSITAMISIATSSCYKEPDLSGYMTLEQFQAWLAEHENDSSGYMTLEEFQAWLAEHENEASGYLTLEQWLAWMSEHSNQVSSVTFNVTFPAADNVTAVFATYAGLEGTISASDVVLVYFLVNLDGVSGWMQLPFEMGNMSIVYSRTNTGKLTFRKGRALHTSFTDGSETFQAKAVIIPSTFYNKMVAAGVNHASYEEVAKVYGLQK